MRKPFQILEEWRAAAARLAAASADADVPALERAVDELRAEYLASFAREVGDVPVAARPRSAATAGAAPQANPSSSNLEDHLVQVSDGFLSVARELLQVEEQKRTLEIGSDEFQVLARRVESLSRRLLALSVEQRETGAELGSLVPPAVTVETLAAGDASA